MNTAVFAGALFALYATDRLVKWDLIARFFAHPVHPILADGWPTVTLIQPVTRGATCLAENLSARALLTYPGQVRHIIVCDPEDEASQAICRTSLPGVELVFAVPDVPGAPIASKVAKMAAGVEHLGDADVVCFVDDDILLPPDGLQILVEPLYSSLPAGAAFGLACQASWNTVWETLMSGFVNANALTGYVPLTFFTAPYTVTGHIFALRRSVFEQTGGMKDLAGRFDDDHEIARRVRALGLHLQQTPLIYRVANAIPTARAYNAQLRRWFVMPRQAMAPYLTKQEQWVSLVLSLGNLIPSALLLCAVCAPGRATILLALAAFILFLQGYVGLEEQYLPAQTPRHALAWLSLIAFLTPLHVLLAYLLPGDRILWRGQSYHARKGGALEVDE